MRSIRTSLMAVMAVAATSLPALADYLVREVGSFHVGGRTATVSGMPTRDVVFSPGAPPIKVDPNGEFAVEQMYVQYVKLAQPKAKVPILLWHGGGLSGVTWETKPDGKPGWQQFFLNSGYDVYVSDAVERGRASWARYPEIFKSEPMFRTKKEAWELFRIGPSYEVGGQRVAFEGAVSDRDVRPVRHAGGPALGHQRRGNAEGLRRAGGKGVSLHRRGAQPGRQFRI